MPDAGSALPRSRPPPPPKGEDRPGDGLGNVTFAISHFYLGNTNFDGTPDIVRGWENYGYDVDGTVTTPDSTDVCKPRNGNPLKYLIDGPDGLDNSYGRNIVSIFCGLNANMEADANARVTSGQYTILIEIEKLGASSDYKPLTSHVYIGTNLGSAPKFDGTDAWPVAPEFLFTTNMTAATLTSSYIVGNTWVSGPIGSLPLPLPHGAGLVTIPVDNLVLTMELDSTHTHVKRGILSGILDVSAVIGDAMPRMFPTTDQDICSGTARDSLQAQLESAADVLKFGDQDPAKECDAISIGLGFDAERVLRGPNGPALALTPSPCP